MSFVGEWHLPNDTLLIRTSRYSANLQSIFILQQSTEESSEERRFVRLCIDIGGLISSFFVFVIISKSCQCSGHYSGKSNLSDKWHNSKLYTFFTRSPSNCRWLQQFLQILPLHVLSRTCFIVPPLEVSTRVKRNSSHMHPYAVILEKHRTSHFTSSFIPDLPILENDCPLMFSFLHFNMSSIKYQVNNNSNKLPLTSLKATKIW